MPLPVARWAVPVAPPPAVAEVGPPEAAEVGPAAALWPAWSPLETPADVAQLVPLAALEHVADRARPAADRTLEAGRPTMPEAGRPKARPRRVAAAPAAAPASPEKARCRAAVLAAQLGEGVSPADLARMRAGCRG